MNRKQAFDALFEKYNGCCSHCGKALTNEEAVVDYIFPARYGGSDRIENLRLLCNSCNMLLSKSNKVMEVEFQQYIQRILQNDKRFQNIKTDTRYCTADGQRLIFDITFTKNVCGKEELFVVESKMITTATPDRIDQIVRQMKHYQASFPNMNFVIAVPIPLANDYRIQIKSSGLILWDQETLKFGIPDITLPINAAPDIYDDLLHKLKNCPAGWDDWKVYQKLVGDILAALFCPPLDSVSEQNADGDNANRRDFVIPNYAEHGYWKHIRERYKAEFIPVDAKNSSEPVGKDDILQVSHYLKEKGLGLFGLIFSRIGLNDAAMIHLKDIWQNENKMIVVLNDNDVEQMLLNKQNGYDPARLIIERIQEFRQKI